MKDCSGRIMVGVDGMEISPEEAERLRSPLVGGCILFGKGYSDSAHIAPLVREVRKAAGKEILVAVDQEGGRVQRFRGGGMTELPPMAWLGDTYARDPGLGSRLAYACGHLMAAELLAVGIDLSFAPVLDLDYGRSAVISGRSIARDMDVLLSVAKEYVAGMHAAGMKAVGKHWPSHGFATADSHVEYPKDPRPADDIIHTDLQPYRPSSGVGVDAVMTAHILYSAADSSIATYSDFWLCEVLRKEVGFEGLVVSDDLCMAGAAGAGDMQARIRSAVGAGCDLVLVCHGWNRDESERELPASGLANPWLGLRGEAGEVEFSALREQIEDLWHD